jgi:hypothetical protein
MNGTPKFRWAAWVVLTLSVLTTTSASAGEWRSQWDSPKSVLERSSPSRLRVVREDRSMVVLEHPRIVADSLVGMVGSRRESVPFTNINHLDVKKGSGLGMAAGVSVILLGGVIGLFAATWE